MMAIPLVKLEGFRNQLDNVEKRLRVAWLACGAPDAKAFVDCISATLDGVISDVLDIRDDMDKAIGAGVDR